MHGCCPTGQPGDVGPSGEGEPRCHGQIHSIRPDENVCYCGKVVLPGPVLPGTRGVIL